MPNLLYRSDTTAVNVWRRLIIKIPSQFQCFPLPLYSILETTPAQARVYMMKNVLSSAEHGRCPHKY